MKRITVIALSTVAGLGIGLAATLICMGLGLQSRALNTLFTLNFLTAVTGVGFGLAIARDTADTITTAQLNRAIGKLNGRYELQPGSEDKLALLIELREELRHGR